MSNGKLSEYYKQKHLITFATSDAEALKVRQKWKIVCCKCLSVEWLNIEMSLKNALQIWSMGGWSHVGGNPLCPSCTNATKINRTTEGGEVTPERYTANLSGFRYRVISRDGDQVTLYCETNHKERTVDEFILRHMFTPVTDNAVDSRACKVKDKSV